MRVRETHRQPYTSDVSDWWSAAFSGVLYNNSLSSEFERTIQSVHIGRIVPDLLVFDMTSYVCITNTALRYVATCKYCVTQPIKTCMFSQPQTTGGERLVFWGLPLGRPSMGGPPVLHVFRVTRYLHFIVDWLQQNTKHGTCDDCASGHYLTYNSGIAKTEWHALMTTNRSKSKPDVEFQYGGQLFSETGSSIPATNWDNWSPNRFWPS